MKTLASILLAFATLAGSAAYAQDSSGETRYRPVIGRASSLTLDRVRRELAAAYTNGFYTFGELNDRVDYGLTDASGSCGSTRSRHGDPPCFLFPQQAPQPFDRLVAYS